MEQTHWHQFFVLSDMGSAMILGGSLGNILKKSPLQPTIFPLSSNKDDVFRWGIAYNKFMILCLPNDERQPHEWNIKYIFIFLSVSSLFDFVFMKYALGNLPKFPAQHVVSFCSCAISTMLDEWCRKLNGSKWRAVISSGYGPTRARQLNSSSRPMPMTRTRRRRTLRNN